MFILYTNLTFVLLFYVVQFLSEPLYSLISLQLVRGAPSGENKSNSKLRRKIESQILFPINALFLLLHYSFTILQHAQYIFFLRCNNRTFQHFLEFETWLINPMKFCLLELPSISWHPNAFI